MMILPSMNNQWVFAFALNFILIICGQNFPLLTRAGWVHAGILGTILWGCLGWNGWLAVVVYLMLGSLVTKLGFKYKQSFGIAEGRGGRRGPENVWGSAATGTCLAMLVGVGLGSRDFLLVGFAASFAAKLADTFGSEIGKRWGRNTILITTFRPVPPGTDGAISLEGTFASVIGSLSMTIVMGTLSLTNGYPLLLIVFFSGILATILESFIGSLAQDKFLWLSNEVVNFVQTTFAALLAMALASLII